MCYKIWRFNRIPCALLSCTHAHIVQIFSGVLLGCQRPLFLFSFFFLIFCCWFPIEPSNCSTWRLSYDLQQLIFIYWMIWHIKLLLLQKQKKRNKQKNRIYASFFLFSGRILNLNLFLVVFSHFAFCKHFHFISKYILYIKWLASHDKYKFICRNS